MYGHLNTVPAFYRLKNKHAKPEKWNANKYTTLKPCVNNIIPLNIVIKL